MFNDLDLKVFSSQNPILQKDFDRFYAIMERSFPKEEMRTYDGFKALCENPYYKIISLFKEGEMIGFFTIWEFENFRFGDHFAIAPEMRGAKIGSSLLKFVLEESSLPLIIEVEFPEDEIAQRRLNFYLRKGFIENSFKYFLPPMQEGCSPLPMIILSYPSTLNLCEFENMRDVIYKEVYEVSEAKNLI